MIQDLVPGLHCEYCNNYYNRAECYFEYDYVSWDDTPLKIPCKNCQRICKQGKRSLDFYVISMLIWEVTRPHSYFHILNSLACSIDDPCINSGACIKGICSCRSDFYGPRCQYGKFSNT